MYYAQIDSNGTVIAVTEAHSSIDSPDMVELQSFDASLVGCNYAAGVFTQTTPVPEPRNISVGAFFDRFGAHKWTVLADANPVVQALIKDCSVRKFINLDDPQLDGGLAMLVGAGHSIDPAAILSAPVQPSEKP